MASPHTAGSLAPTTKEPGSAIFRFRGGARPKPSSTTRACAENTEIFELYQAGPRQPPAGLPSHLDSVLFPAVPKPPLAFIVLLTGLHFPAFHSPSPVLTLMSHLAPDLETMSFPSQYLHQRRKKKSQHSAAASRKENSGLNLFIIVWPSLR